MLYAFALTNLCCKGYKPNAAQVRSKKEVCTKYGRSSGQTRLVNETCTCPSIDLLLTKPSSEDREKEPEKQRLHADELFCCITNRVKKCNRESFGVIWNLSSHPRPFRYELISSVFKCCDIYRTYIDFLYLFLSLYTFIVITMK